MTRTTRSGLGRVGPIRSLCSSLAVISPKVCRRASKHACWCESIRYDRCCRFTVPNLLGPIYDASKSLDVTPER